MSKAAAFAALSEAQKHLTKSRLFVREGLMLLAYQEAERAQHAAFEAKDVIDDLLKESGTTESELAQVRASLAP